MCVQDAIEAGYRFAATAGGDMPLENMTHRADLQFDAEAETLAAAWTDLVAIDDRHMGRGIYPLKF